MAQTEHACATAFEPAQTWHLRADKQIADGQDKVRAQLSSAHICDRVGPRLMVRALVNIYPRKTAPYQQAVSQPERRARLSGAV